MKEKIENKERPEQRSVAEIQEWLDTPMENPDSIRDLTHDLALAARDLKWLVARLEAAEAEESRLHALRLNAERRAKAAEAERDAANTAAMGEALRASEAEDEAARRLTKGGEASADASPESQSQGGHASGPPSTLAAHDDPEPDNAGEVDTLVAYLAAHPDETDLNELGC